MATQYLSLYLKRNRDEYYTRLQRIRARHSVAEAAHEHGLAGTGLASDEHELAAPLARDSVERRRQRRELAGALEQLTGDRGGGQALHDRHAEDGEACGRPVQGPRGTPAQRSRPAERQARRRPDQRANVGRTRHANRAQTPARTGRDPRR